MRRSVFRMLSLLSLAMLLVVASMWMRSYWLMDHYSFRTPTGFDHKIRSDVGRFSYFYVTNAVVAPTDPMLQVRPVLNSLPSTELYDSGGFYYRYSKMVLSPTYKLERFFLIIPYWSLALTAGLIPTLHYLRYRRGHLRAKLARLATGEPAPDAQLQPATA